MEPRDISDPRVVPRWVEAGVSGVPRAREWDVVVAVAAAELAGATLADFAFTAFAEGPVVPAPETAVPERVLAALAAELDRALDRPYEARATRRDADTWWLAARRRPVELLELAVDVDATSLAVAVPPGAEPVALVDGEPAEPFVERDLAEALAELERRGRLRFQSFAARADRVDGRRWRLTIDPL